MNPLCPCRKVLFISHFPSPSSHSHATAARPRDGRPGPEQANRPRCGRQGTGDGAKARADAKDPRKAAIGNETDRQDPRRTTKAKQQAARGPRRQHLKRTDEKLHSGKLAISSQGDCGRPLGLYFHPWDKSKLYVADAKNGILSIDLDTRRVQILVNAHQPGNGIAPLTFVDDLVVLSNGSVFFTDLSKKFGYDDVEAEVMEARPNGRLFHFSPSDGSLHTALEGLHGANGVCVGPNEEFLLVAELTRARVTRYYLKGPKAGTVDTFAQNLPGLPDNITPSSRGGYWVGFGALRDNGVLDMMAGLPWLRALVYKSKLMASIKALVQKHGMIVELDASGQIVRSLHDPNGVVVTSSTTVLDLGDTFLIGSYYAPYITVCTM
eukprot:Em0015g231a